MRFFFKATYAMALFMGCLSVGKAQNAEPISINLNNLSAFSNPGSNWNTAAGVSADLIKSGEMKMVKGNGVVVNILNKKDNKHLITKNEFGDLALELDFMMAKNSNSGVYLQGRYELQLFDSWTQIDPKFSDCGGIYQRFDGKGFEGVPPMVNVAKAPGLWQHLKIKFRAPRFDAQGKKTENARFEEVYLNGTLVQQQVAVTGPTLAAIFNDEKATGPIVFQGDHGAVAFRNIRYQPLTEVTSDKEKKQANFDDPILINPENKPSLLRSFMNFGNKKLTHIISVGYPDQLNYAYNLKQGSVFQVWRGGFLDVTEMWYERGEPQLAKPLGSVITLSNGPVLAVLSDEKASWPDSIAFDDMHNDGYVLDQQHSPAFKYEWKGMQVTDKISSQKNGESLLREISVTNPIPNLYGRIITGARIEKLADDLFAINDRSFYIRIDKGLKAQIRDTQNGQEIIVRFGSQNTPISYSIIW
ncbi:MAG: 3-keto-disaccharide hydrolase [Sphingobacteriaceae bacterium]